MEDITNDTYMEIIATNGNASLEIEMGVQLSSLLMWPLETSLVDPT